MRKRDPQRLEDIAEAAVGCFSEVGYARTQMSDIAKRAGVSAGTLYLYVRSKAALLTIALLKAGNQPLGELSLPFDVDEPDHVVSLVKSFTDGRSRRWPQLRRALRAGNTPSNGILTDIGLELYDLLLPARRVIWLLDKLVLDLPEIREAHARYVRGRYIDDLVRLLGRAPDRVPPSHARVVVRAAIELMAWAAMHRHREDPAQFGSTREAEVRALAAAAFAAALRPAWTR